MTVKEEFLSLLERDKEFRYAVAGFLGLDEILRRLDEHGERMVKLEERMLRVEEELARLREEQIKLREDMAAGFKRHDEIMVKLREDMNAGFKRHDEMIAKLREDMVSGFRRHDEEIAKLREDMNRGFMLLERHISALGARWGLMSEEAFREGIRSLLGEELGFKAERWMKFDGEGSVYGYPSQVEVDVAVHDSRLILMEIKAHVGASDVYTFKRKAEFYERVEGRKPQRLVMVTPYADGKALEASIRLGVELYTKI